VTAVNEEKTAMAKKETATAMATKEEGALALVQHDELAGVLDFEVESDGLEEADASDVKLAAKVFNMKGVDGRGDPLPPNVFFDTVTETSKRELDLLPFSLHKSKEWREYDEAKGESVIHCRSNDRVTGRMADGKERPCEGCPDAQWTTVNGKRNRRCGDIYNLFAIERDTQQPCVIRFKRTSLTVIQGHLNKHHLGKRIVSGKRGNYPLFSFLVKATLKMSDDKKYAIPVLEKTGVAPREEMLLAAESAKYVREQMLPALEKIAEKDSDSAGATKREPTFNQAEFVDEPGADGLR
jgi:hypothetical protein